MEKEIHKEPVSLSGKSEETENFGEPIQKIQKREWANRISPSFLMIVSELRDFLNQMKQKLDEDEARIQNESQGERPLLGKKVLDTAEETATRTINRCIAGITEVVRYFSPREHNLYRNYFQEQLHPYLLLSPFVKRAYTKPLGIPGDYEMMNMLYGDHDQGETLFARFVNRHCCRVTAARAVASRVPYMRGKLDHVVERVLETRETVSIMSVGSGPAQEIENLIRANPMADRCQVTLIDTDPEALQYCHEKIRKIKMASQSRIKTLCLNRSVRQLIQDPSCINVMKDQDLIYAVGLFDYMPSHIAKHLIQKLYRSLSERGELIIGNLSVWNDARYYMEYGAEWYLVYRTPEEMIRLAERISSSKIFVETGEQGAQLYLVIKKESEESIDKHFGTATLSYGTA